MLTRLSVKNFRLLRDVTIDVEPGKPIVLIGPNGAGKSSVIQVLDLLGRAARDGWTEAVQAFPGDGSFVSAGAHELNVEVTLQRGQHELWRVPSPLRYGFGFSPRAGFCEELDARPNGATIELLRRKDSDNPFDDGVFWVLNQRTQARDAQVTRLGYGLSFEMVKHQDYPALSVIRELLGALPTYDAFLTTPVWTREVREGRLTPFDGTTVAPCPRIDRRGLDLINALYYLQSSFPDEWDELDRNFKAEFPFVQRLEFPADPAGGRIGLAWRDRRYPGVRMHGQQMSEGMATYLCLLAAILTPEPATAIAFDEPDRHLHPSALRRVAYLLEKLSERTAVFVATHSDRFLDYLSDPAGSLRVCEPSDEGVSIRPLDREALDAWRAEYTLSELRERGHLDPSNASAVEP